MRSVIGFPSTGSAGVPARSGTWTWTLAMPRSPGPATGTTGAVGADGPMSATHVGWWSNSQDGPEKTAAPEGEPRRGKAQALAPPSTDQVGAGDREDRWPDRPPWARVATSPDGPP